MDENKHNLEEPATSYGREIKSSEVVFEPMPRMMESLRAQGYLTHEEFVERMSKYI